MNEAWECPRCHRINAPFNPSCFCKPEDKKYDSPKQKISDELSSYATDLGRYLEQSELPSYIPTIKEFVEHWKNRKNEVGKKISEELSKVNLPKNTCSICGKKHWEGLECSSL